MSGESQGISPSSLARKFPASLHQIVPKPGYLAEPAMQRYQAYLESQMIKMDAITDSPPNELDPAQRTSTYSVGGSSETTKHPDSHHRTSLKAYADRHSHNIFAQFLEARRVILPISAKEQSKAAQSSSDESAVPFQDKVNFTLPQRPSTAPIELGTGTRSGKKRRRRSSSRSDSDSQRRDEEKRSPKGGSKRKGINIAELLTEP